MVGGFEWVSGGRLVLGRGVFVELGEAGFTVVRVWNRSFVLSVLCGVGVLGGFFVESWVLWGVSFNLIVLGVFRRVDNLRLWGVW